MPSESRIQAQGNSEDESYSSFSILLVMQRQQTYTPRAQQEK
jgi:hypothetical protein